MVTVVGPLSSGEYIIYFDNVTRIILNNLEEKLDALDLLRELGHEQYRFTRYSGLYKFLESKGRLNDLRRMRL
tara:strand:- start:323 stop:541 length:219 start_codon:yes stop_codon:yes gene_type:complete